MKKHNFSKKLISLTLSALTAFSAGSAAITTAFYSAPAVYAADGLSPQESKLLKAEEKMIMGMAKTVFKDIPWASTGKVVALRFAIMMILRFVLVGLLHVFWPDVNLTPAINVMFILPPPFVLPVFADDADQRVYVSSALSMSTLVSIAGFAVLAVLG